MTALTQKELKRVLKYCPDTGVFARRITTSSRAREGATPGWLEDSTGYWRISLNRKQYYAHRLAFLYMLGEMPCTVDHKDQNKLNNTWKNLRPATRVQNKYAVEYISASWCLITTTVLAPDRELAAAEVHKLHPHCVRVVDIEELELVMPRLNAREVYKRLEEIEAEDINIDRCLYLEADLYEQMVRMVAESDDKVMAPLAKAMLHTKVMSFQQHVEKFTVGLEASDGISN